MARLFGFDYKSPYFYMVTLKRIRGLAAFSQIGPQGLVEDEITSVFAAVIRSFHKKWRCLDEISPFVIMPDHLHPKVIARRAMARPESCESSYVPTLRPRSQ